MKKVLSRIWFFLTHDIVSAKSVLLIWGPSLLLILAGIWLNKIDPDFQWWERDVMYWGDKLTTAGSILFVGGFFVWGIIRMALDGKSDSSK